MVSAGPPVHFLPSGSKLISSRCAASLVRTWWALMLCVCSVFSPDQVQCLQAPCTMWAFLHTPTKSSNTQYNYMLMSCMGSPECNSQHLHVGYSCRRSKRRILY